MSIREDLLAMLLDGGGKPHTGCEIQKAWRFGETDFFYGVTPVDFNPLKMTLVGAGYRPVSEKDSAGVEHLGYWMNWNVFSVSVIGKIVGESLEPIVFSPYGTPMYIEHRYEEVGGQVIQYEKLKEISVGDIKYDEYSDYKTFYIDRMVTNVERWRYDYAQEYWYSMGDDMKDFRGYGNSLYEIPTGIVYTSRTQCPEHWQNGDFSLALNAGYTPEEILRIKDEFQRNIDKSTVLNLIYDRSDGGWVKDENEVK